MSRWAAESPIRGHVYSPHNPGPPPSGGLTTSRPTKGPVCLRTRFPLSFPILAFSLPAVLPTPSSASLTPVPAAAVSGPFGGSPCVGLCPHPAKRQPGHLLFDSSVGPNPKPHMLSFKLSCDHGAKRAGSSCLYLGRGHTIHTSPTVIWGLGNQRHLTAQHRTGPASGLVSCSCPQNASD